MDTLEQARAEIDAVDAQLAALFERRMAAVLSVAPIQTGPRPADFLTPRGRRWCWKKAAARIRNAALRPYYKDHVQNMMDVAKQYEAEVLGRNRAAYQGVEGAFAHIALRALFPPRGGRQLPDVGRGVRCRQPGRHRPRRCAV